MADEQDSLISAYKFKLIEDEVVKAGTPAVYIMPGDYEHDSSVEVATGALSFNPVYNTALSVKRDTVNGLIGILANYNAPDVAIGLFSSDSIEVGNNSSLVAYQRAYVVPALVKNLEGSNDDDV